MVDINELEAESIKQLERHQVMALGVTNKEIIELVERIRKAESATPKQWCGCVNAKAVTNGKT